MKITTLDLNRRYPIDLVETVRALLRHLPPEHYAGISRITLSGGAPLEEAQDQQPRPERGDPFAARRKKANEGLAFAEKRLALAEVVLQGGFPEEMLRPIRESLGWGLTSLLALHHDHDPAADLPSPPPAVSDSSTGLRGLTNLSGSIW